MIRIGVDFGGTKIEAAALDETGRAVVRRRTPNPGGYEAALQTVKALIAQVEADSGPAASVGMGVPGSISPLTGHMRNANSVWLNGKPFREDLEAMLGRPVRLANDANCFALSEARELPEAKVVFGVIIGTGCGGGVVVDGQVLEGANGVAGEWGHTPLPWPTPDEYATMQRCWCGRMSCLETWISGTGFRQDYARAGHPMLGGAEIVARAAAGEGDAAAALDRYVDRLGRALAVVCDIVDPQAVVLGGGMSQVGALYERVPEALGRYIFSDVLTTRLLPPKHGDSSGVFGAAWLWG